MQFIHHSLEIEWNKLGDILIPVWRDLHYMATVVLGEDNLSTDTYGLS